MKKFEAVEYEEDERIVLRNAEDIQPLFDLLESETNFILEWTTEKGDKVSELMIAASLAASVKTGDMILSAKQKK